MDNKNSNQSPEVEAYGDSTPLTWLFGNIPIVKIISVLLSEGDKLMQPTEIDTLAGIRHGTTNEELQKLLSYDLITIAQNTEGEIYCKINKNSPIMKNLARLEIALLNHRNQHQD